MGKRRIIIIYIYNYFLCENNDKPLHSKSRFRAKFDDNLETYGNNDNRSKKKNQNVSEQFLRFLKKIFFYFFFQFKYKDLTKTIPKLFKVPTVQYLQSKNR